MEYPLIIGGRQRGTLRMTQEGLYTIFEAELPQVYEGLYRIWLHGGGRSAYLGLMQPWSGGMYLRKKLSKNAMRGFPQTVESVSDEEGASAETAPHIEKTVTESAPACPYPAPVPQEDEGLLWLRRPDGSLSAHDGISSLVALPANLRGESRGAVIRQIEGKEYIVFRY